MTQNGGNELSVSLEHYQVIQMMAEATNLAPPDFIDEAAILGVSLAQVVLEVAPEQVNIGFEVKPDFLHTYPLYFGDWTLLEGAADDDGTDTGLGTKISVDEMPPLYDDVAETERASRRIILPLSPDVVEPLTDMATMLDVNRGHFLTSSLSFRWLWGLSTAKQLGTYIKWADGSFTPLVHVD